jgi:hypothetical protein
MTAHYVFHRVTTAPRLWQAVAETLAARREVLAAAGGGLYGLWRSQIGRPRDEVTAITAWTVPMDAAGAEALLLEGACGVQGAARLAMAPTLWPTATQPPIRQGNYAFRWFVTPEADWVEFLDLCARAWPGFEAAYDSQVIGLWRCIGEPADEDAGFGPCGTGHIRSLLLTRRPDLAMWERSKLPQGKAETAVRDALSRRYDLCTWTVVSTTTLLTAADAADRARWT